MGNSLITSPQENQIYGQFFEHKPPCRRQRLNHNEVTLGPIVLGVHEKIFWNLRGGIFYNQQHWANMICASAIEQSLNIRFFRSWWLPLSSTVSVKIPGGQQGLKARFWCCRGYQHPMHKKNDGIWNHSEMEDPSKFIYTEFDCFTKPIDYVKMTIGILMPIRQPLNSPCSTCPTSWTHSLCYAAIVRPVSWHSGSSSAHSQLHGPGPSEDDTDPPGWEDAGDVGIQWSHILVLNRKKTSFFAPLNQKTDMETTRWGCWAYYRTYSFWGFLGYVHLS